MIQEQDAENTRRSIGRSWYHHDLDSKKCKEVLMQRGKHGSFLVRPRRDRKGWAVCVKWGNEIVNMKFSQNPEDGTFTVANESKAEFSSMADLIMYYTEHPLVLKKSHTGSKSVTLRQPFNTQDPINERWYHGMISNERVEYLMSTHGQQGSYLIKQSVSSPDNYVLAVRTNKAGSGDADIAYIIITKDAKDALYCVVGEGGSARQYYSLIDLVEQLPPGHTPEGQCVCLKYPVYTTTFTVRYVKVRIDELIKSNLVNGQPKAAYQEEFMNLQTEMFPDKFTEEAAKSDLYKKLNRYKNILPWDHSRVHLKDGGKPEYINANYIKSELIDADLEPCTYIATQGCLAHTMVDFWRMVLQENTRVILMTTKIIENGKNKCAKYFPDASDPDRAFDSDMGLIRVKIIKEENKHSFVMREIQIEREGSSPVNARRVFQYHFHAWPDYGVPKDPGILLSYLRDVKIKQAELEKRHRDRCGPMIIHCSAGIGRTGTLIVMDILIRQVIKRGLDTSVDIYETIRLLRHQRKGFIQTEIQYKFLYIALEHYVGTMLQRMGQHEGGKGKGGGGGDYENMYNNVQKKRKPPIAPKRK